MEKLSHVEAQRVIGVLGDALEQLACLARVPEHANPAIFEALEARDRQQVVACLESQFQYEEALVVAQERRRGIDALSQLEKKLRTNTRALCRILRDDNVACETLEDLVSYEERKVGENIDDEVVDSRGRSMSKSSLGDLDARGAEKDEIVAVRHVTSEALADWLGGLRNVVFRALTTTVEEEHAEKEYLQSVSNRKDEAEEDRSTLETELAIVRRNRNRMVSELDARVRKLEAELRDVKQTADEEEALLEREISSKRTALDDEHRRVCEALHAEEKRLHEELDKMTADMEEKETSLSKKKNKAQAEVNGQIDTFDAELGAKRDELDRLRRQYDAETTRLNELEEHFERVDIENARIAREEEEWAAFVLEQTAESRARDHGAASVQKLFRGYVARAEVQNMAKKGKKGGKKK